MQHTAAYFFEPRDDPEFENIEIVIDRSFIRRAEHTMFWKEWLRNGLVGRSHRSEAFLVLDEWHKRDHPFIRKYGRDGIFDFNDLYQKHTRFDDSKATLGLQVADICAHICYRTHRSDVSVRPTYDFLKRRIVGQHGRKLTIIQFTEQTLFTGAVEEHVKILDVEAMKAVAAKRKSKRQHGNATNSTSIETRSG